MINFSLDKTLKKLKWVPTSSALIALHSILGADLHFDQNTVT